MTKKLLSAILITVLLITSVTISGMVSANAAAAPSFKIKSVTKLTYNDAQINATVNNPSKVRITRVGFQLGTVKNKWTTTKSENTNKTSGFDAWYLMSKWNGKLKSNTTYYYRFYLTASGKNYYSSTNSFKTKPNYPYFTVKNVTNLAYNNAQINAYVNNPTGSKITKVGFVIGTSKDKLSTNKSEAISKTTGFDVWYLMSKWYGSLVENKTYYYKFYCVSGKTYYSGIYNFKTPQKPIYTKVTSKSISRIVQPANDQTGSCYLSSIATLYGYKTGSCKAGGKDYSQNSAVYKTVLAKNKGYNKQDKNGKSDVWVNDKTVTYFGLKKQGYSLSNLYNSLKARKPAVIYSGRHASLVIGYKGQNATSLKASDSLLWR